MECVYVLWCRDCMHDIVKWIDELYLEGVCEMYIRISVEGSVCIWCMWEMLINAMFD